jgi:hypothetical protein
MPAPTPTITFVSPDEFSDQYAIARTTPVVVDVTYVGPGAGLSQITITHHDTVVYFGSPGGSLEDGYEGSVVVITDGYRFSFYPEDGWSPVADSFVVVAYASEVPSEYTASLTLPAFDLGSPQDFRDAVWRWRRRLRRQKCSVISVAIDDNYSNGPGFVLTALSLEIGRKTGLDRVPWRGGSTTNTHGSSDIGNGR